MNTDAEKGGANPSYKGYAYQKLVSVWVSLKLMFGPDARANEMIVEPASHDDIAAMLDVPEENADGELTIGAESELHIQIKFKGAGYWSSGNFADVVNDKTKTGTRGPARRVRAKTLLLKHPNRRYVFITNTSVDETLAKGRIKAPAEAADPTFLPTNLQLDVNDSSSLTGRFAVIEQMTFEETRRQIDNLLSDLLNVPAHRLDECVARLQLLVEGRFMDMLGPLRKTDVERVAQSMGGLPHPDPRLAHYVAPTSAADAEQMLRHKNSVLLIGPSGYGKSLTAEKLADAGRRAHPPFRVMDKDSDTGELEQAFRSPARVLFYLDDPWGQSGLNQAEASRWTNTLGKWLPHASAEKQFVITSRSEIYRLALGEAPAPVWADRTVVIDDASYGTEARRAILHGNLESAASWRQDLARHHEQRLLDDLRSPFELAGFAHELRAVAKTNDFDLNTLIDRAQSDGRKHVVMEHARSFGDSGLRGAAVLWALLRHSRPLDPLRLIKLRREMDLNASEEVALDDLAEHLAQTQLEKDSNGAFQAHSQVAEALKSLARTHSRLADKALNAAARSACRLARSDVSWLDELERLYEAILQLDDKNVVVADDVVDGLDSLLIDGLRDSVDCPKRFRSLWRSARSHLSGRSATGKVVDWLSHGRPRARRSFYTNSWLAPKLTDADRIEILVADSQLRIVRGFIANVLPKTQEDYNAAELLPWLKTFGVDFTDAFLKAGKVVCATAEFAMNGDAISEGAMSWPEPPRERVWKQVLKLNDLVEAAQTRSEERRRQAHQGELDFAEQLMIVDRTEDEVSSSAHFAEGYVLARRRDEGFDWITDHPRPDLILPTWARVMNYKEPVAGEAEVKAYFDTIGDDDWLRAAGLNVVGERKLEFGRAQVEAAIRVGGPRALRAAVNALGWLEGDSSGRKGKTSAVSILLAMIGSLTLAQAASLAPFILELASPEEKDAIADNIVSAAGPHKGVVSLAIAVALKVDHDGLVTIFRQLQADEAHALILDGPRSLGRQLLMIAASEGWDVGSIAAAWIDHGDDTDARAAVRALAYQGSDFADDAIELALDHSDYKVRRDALRILAPRSNGARRYRLLKMMKDPSAPVRSALAVTIGANEWAEGIPALVALLEDTRDYVPHPERQRRQEVEYGVARAAADALHRFQPLPATTITHILATLDSIADKTIDVEIHARLIDLLSHPEDNRIWSTLERCLEDDHVVGTSSENLYPVRYAAAWSIVVRLSVHPDQMQLAPWEALTRAAVHLDPQLAAPALVALGQKLAVEADALALDTLRDEQLSPARVALALATIEDSARARSLARTHRLLPNCHPLLELGKEPDLDPTREGSWSISDNGLEWLRQLDKDDVENVLLYVISEHADVGLSPEGYDPRALRREEGVPVITLAEMFGME